MTFPGISMTEWLVDWAASSKTGGERLSGDRYRLPQS